MIIQALGYPHFRKAPNEQDESTKIIPIGPASGILCIAVDVGIVRFLLPGATILTISNLGIGNNKRCLLCLWVSWSYWVIVTINMAD